MPTTPLGIWTPDDTDDWDLTVDLAATAISVDTVVSSSRNALRGLDAAKGAAGTEGRTYYATDTNRSYFDDGTNWISNDPGMYLVRPSAVSGTGVSIASNGRIVLTGAAALTNIDGIFSSRFRSYKVIVDVTTPSNDTLRMQYRAGGVTNFTGASYTSQLMYPSGSTTAASVVYSAAWHEFATFPSINYKLTFDFINPQIAAESVGFFQCYNANAAAAQGFAHGMLRHNASTAFDGLSISMVSGNMTGTITVYGLT